MERMTKNLKRIFFALALIAVALACRLAYIQLAGGEELAAVTRAQSMIALKGSNTRGIIYDRNGAALVADRKRYVYIIRENRFDHQALGLLRQIGAEEVSADNEGHRVYSSENYDREIGSRLIDQYDAYILQASGRYSDDQTASHFIGYVNQKDASGAAGLELMYDDRLSALHRSIYAAADVNGNILQGRGLVITSHQEIDSYAGEGIRTTLDKELQEAVEDIIQQREKDCAVVVLDVRTGGVAAMACTPGFNPNKISQHMSSDSDELVNKATQGEYAPGSVFKIITAAAALEAGMGPDLTFTCKNAVKIGDISIGCETGGEEGHGKIGLKDAFAKSCNSFFIQLGQEMGADAIIETAAKCHLGEKALNGYPQESAGHLMTTQERQGAAIGNLAIGQGETLTTPLQIARMTNIIASDGIDRGVHVLMEEEGEAEQVLSPNTAEAVGAMMAQTVIDGTASFLELYEADGSPKAAVKTGTAEYGDADEEKSHGWMTGYTPCEEPEYAITVFVEDGASGSGSAGPIFKEIITYLEESGSYSMPTLA